VNDPRLVTVGRARAAPPADAWAADSPREEARIAEVRRYEILGTPPDGAFDRIAMLAAQLLDMPIAIVSIVDVDRIWFKSHHGIDATEVARDPGLCASAVLEQKPWVVEDAAIDPRTLTNPLVAGKLGLRAYAGAQLVTRDGHNLGMLCVLDRRPRTFSAQHIEILKGLADVVVRELEVRLAARRTVLAIVGEVAAEPGDASQDRDEGILSRREREVLQAAAQGLTNEEIAARLFVSHDTVKTHLRSVYRKLGVRNRVEASAFARDPV
jgi:DNA-binding CsgD family transcriptional regulator